MNEAQRQSYLKAMGLTPWVARVALPGAAPSPALDWPEEEQANAPASAGPVVDVAMPSREPESAPVDAPLAAAESSPAHLSLRLSGRQQKRRPLSLPRLRYKG